MVIYPVVRSYDGHDELYALFSTYEKAKKCADKFNRKSDYRFRVVMPFKLDEE